MSSHVYAAASAPGGSITPPTPTSAAPLIRNTPTTTTANNTTTTTTTPIGFVCEQSIVTMCAARVDMARVLQQPGAPTICVDGTSCAKKTSILERTGYPVLKTQRCGNFPNINSWFPSTIGYIATGLNACLMPGREPLFHDRSPLNAIEWRLLWMVMDDYMRRFGNEPVCDIMHLPPNDLRYTRAQYMHECLNVYRELFRALLQVDYYRLFRSQLNCIAIIDTNVQRCDTLRARRDNNSDRERSAWKFYTPLQNLMYETLYEGQLIDLQWFDDYECPDTSVIVSGIATFLTNQMASLVAAQERGTAKRLHPIRCAQLQMKLPCVRMHDENLANVSTHVNRSIGRWMSRGAIAADASYPPEDSNAAVGASAAAAAAAADLQKYLPSYCVVDGVERPPFMRQSGAPLELAPFDVRSLMWQRGDDANDDDDDDDDGSNMDDESRAGGGAAIDLADCYDEDCFL